MQFLEKSVKKKTLLFNNESSEFDNKLKWVIKQEQLLKTETFKGISSMELMIMNQNPSKKINPHTLVPVSRFKNGVANKVVTEVKKNGIKVVTEDNLPIYVLLSPKYYEELIELLDGYELPQKVEKTINKKKDSDWVSHEKRVKQFGLDESDIDNTNDEIN